MPSLTLNLPEQLQAKIQPFSRWLSVILEISLLNLKSPAYQAASEVIDFLMSNPSNEAVRAYKLSETMQNRVEVLLEKNRAGTLSENELVELDDYLKLEHVMGIVKAKLRATVAV
jgi:hypothetical protein